MNKMTSFQALVYSHLPMVVSVTETWLSDYILMITKFYPLVTFFELITPLEGVVFLLSHQICLLVCSTVILILVL